MKPLREFLFEAKLGDIFHDVPFYHGNSNETASKSILVSKSLRPGAETQGRGLMSPVAGRTYLTPSLSYAQIYAIGGDMAGSTHHRITGDHGHVFVTHGRHLGDVQPDEDSVGEMVHSKKLPWLTRFSETHLNPSTHRKIMSAEYSAWASGGKQLVRKMTDSQKLDVIHAGGHVAVSGEVPITGAWRVHKDKVPLLVRDASNFFDHAEKVL